MSVGYNPKIVTDGLVLCLDAANPKSYPGSGTIWTDLTGIAGPSTLQTGSTYSNTNGGTISFDGINGYVSSTSSSLPDIVANGNVTQEAFIFLNSLTTTAAIIVKGRTGTTFNFGMAINTDGTLRFRNTNVGRALTSVSAIITGVWMHVSITTDSSGSTGFVNGVQQLSDSLAVTTTNAISELAIGRRSVSGNTPNSEYLDGKIALVKIYNRALSATEIKQNFNALRGRFGI